MNDPHDPEALLALAATTQDIYERNAARFDRERPKGLHERIWIDRFLERVTPGGRILDLGCGTGDPIAAYMAGCGFRVTGLDASPAMLAIARERFPNGDWRQGDMRTLDLGETFDGILGWDSFFHLTDGEQRAALPRIARHLVPGGAVMLTVGPEAGAVTGCVGDDAVHHASLARDEYSAILEANGLALTDFVAEDPDCDLHTILMAVKPA